MFANINDKVIFIPGGSDCIITAKSISKVGSLESQGQRNVTRETSQCISALVFL